MGFISRTMAASTDSSMSFEISRLARTISSLILRAVDGSNPDERRLVASAKQLGDLVNSGASWRLTASYLLSTCEFAIEAVDFSTKGERQLYNEALDLVRQFEYSRASCA